MILTKTVKVKVIGKTTKYYKDLGYNVKPLDIIEISIEHLSKRSRIKILVKCDVCGIEKELSKQKYTKNIKSYGYYACSQKCSVNKCQKTFLKNYGEISPLKNEIIKEKLRQTCLEKYGVDSYLKTDEFKQKFKDISNEKYGYDYPMQCEEIKEKLKNSVLKKYGVESVSYLKNIQEKIKETKIKNGIISSDENAGELKIYKRKIKNITHRVKKQLFENWDGYDYYDNEYIKDYRLLNCMDSRYPTIDHKISVLYGFLNNIDPEIIGDLSNLCITKKSINSIKKEKNIFLP